MYNILSTETWSSFMSCLCPFFASPTAAASEPSSLSQKYVNNVRARVGKSPKPQDIPLQRIAESSRALDRADSPVTAAVPALSHYIAPFPLTVKELGEIFDKIEETLSSPGIPYAICGLAAILAYGSTGRNAYSVSVLVPGDVKDVVLPWALTGGNAVSRISPNGFVLRMNDGIQRNVKVRWIDRAAFEKMGIAKSTMGRRGAQMLTLASCIEQVANAFVEALKRGKASADKDHVETIVQDIRGMLRTAAGRRELLDAAHLELFLSAQFWGAFRTYTGKGAKKIFKLCRKARLPVSEALDTASRQSEIRQHNALLGRYGAEPMPAVVEQQPSAFQGMRTLDYDDLGCTPASASESSQKRAAGPSSGRSLTRPRCAPRRSNHDEVDPDDEGASKPGIFEESSPRDTSARTVPSKRDGQAAMDQSGVLTDIPGGWL
jgi:hypothetical protein